MKKIIYAVISVILVISGYFICEYVETTNFTGQNLIKEEGMLRVSYIDVGQGDANLIELPDGKNMMIDCGNLENGVDLVEFLKERKIKKIDYLVATHPHSDHIGGMSTIIKNFEIGDIFMPKAYTDTKTYFKLLNTIKENNLKITEATAGKKIEGKDYTINVLSPQKKDYEDLNDYSIVIKLDFKARSFLFMGDASEYIEYSILGNDLESDVLKVGHHGSKSASSLEFINSVRPKYSIISCGLKNRYGHPHKTTLKNLSRSEVLITYEKGTIVFLTDGEKLSYQTEK